MRRHTKTAWQQRAPNWCFASLALGAGLLLAAAPDSYAAENVWRTSWGISMQGRAADAQRIENRTIRQTLTLSAGGQALRIRVSNEFGASPIAIGAATLRLPGADFAALTFGGLPHVRIPAGAQVLSDSISMALPAGAELEISLYLPESTSLSTYKRLSSANGAAVSDPGDHTRGDVLPEASETYPVLLRSVEVLTDTVVAGLVILGDTKSAGPETWPDKYVKKTAGRVAVANRSIFAGRLFFGDAGDNGLARFDRDVAATTGATHVLVFLGNNDLIQPGLKSSSGDLMIDPAEALSTAEIQAALAQLALRAHALELKVIAGTWTPYAGANVTGYASHEKLAARRAINDWLRDSDLFDAVVDFDAALRDPANPEYLDKRYDSGNGFTPSAAGYDRMAEQMAASALP